MTIFNSELGAEYLAQSHILMGSQGSFQSCEVFLIMILNGHMFFH